MNLDLDISVFSRFFRGIVTELRQKRLWPVAALLVVALVAVPFLLSKSSKPAPAPQAQVPTTPPPTGASIPTLNVVTTPSQSHLRGPSRNPFGASGSSSAAAHTLSSTTSTVTAVSTASNNSTSTLASGGASSSGVASSSGAASSGAPSSSATSTSPSPNPQSITGSAKPKPAITGLTDKQAYDVSMAITTSGGGINTVDPLERSSLIPSDQQPMLIELGVEQGGNHVLFAVQPGTVPVGPGSCTPGPIDCEILSLGQDQTEELATQTGSLGASQVALFAITGISATNYPSTAAADKARRTESAAGRTLLAQDSYPTLSLFQYEPSLGSVVDLRNLKVGG